LRNKNDEQQLLKSLAVKNKEISSRNILKNKESEIQCDLIRPMSDSSQPLEEEELTVITGADPKYLEEHKVSD